MIRFLRSCLLLPLLLWALLLPKLSVILLEFNPNIQTVVICTGTEMVTITVGPDGEPIHVDDGEDAPCVLTEDKALSVPSDPDWVALARSYAFAFVVNTNPALQRAPERLSRDSQAPPLA
ncbi:MAG: hypothetical protein AAF222_13820 [Pseudomonadota bacterium]